MLSIVKIIKWSERMLVERKYGIVCWFCSEFVWLNFVSCFRVRNLWSVMFYILVVFFIRGLFVMKSNCIKGVKICWWF